MARQHHQKSRARSASCCIHSSSGVGHSSGVTGVEGGIDGNACNSCAINGLTCTWNKPSRLSQKRTHPCSRGANELTADSRGKNGWLAMCSLLERPLSPSSSLGFQQLLPLFSACERVSSLKVAIALLRHRTGKQIGHGFFSPLTRCVTWAHVSGTILTAFGAIIGRKERTLEVPMKRLHSGRRNET